MKNLSILLVQRVSLSFVLWITVNGVQAQGEQIPGSIRPGQIEQQLKELPTPKADRPAVNIIQEQQIPPADDGTQSFQFKGVKISGATVYTDAEINTFFADLIGKNVTLKQVRVAANNAVAKYRNEGYVLAQILIPKQTLKDGVVRIDVLEGSIDQIKFQGDSSSDVIGLLDNYIAKIKATKPIKIDSVERYLLLINDLPGVTAQGSLVPSGKQSGSADLVININRQRFSGSIGFNNRLTKLLGTYRGEVYGEANNLLGLQDKTYARVLQSFEDKMTVLSLGEDLPIFSEGTRISFMLNQVWSNTPLYSTSSGLNSKQISFNVGLSHPLIRSRSANLTVRGTFSMVDSHSIDEFHNTAIANDRIRSLRVGLTYDLADSWRGINIADLELSQGINALGARNPSAASRDKGTAQLSAAQGQVDYVKVNLYLARLQAIAPNWALLVAAQGQFTEDVLLAPEQFSLGGEQFLRAYDPSEFIGDKGFATKAELRYTFTPFDNLNTTLYSFYDHGQIFYNYKRPGFSVDAAGVGVRISMNRYLSGYIEGAQPLHPIQTTDQNKDMRLFGGIKLTY